LIVRDGESTGEKTTIRTGSHPAVKKALEEDGDAGAIATL